jgi:single-strand DNA-binding protein
MAGEPIITVVGNVVDDPELRFTPSGKAVCNFRLASTPRTKDGDQWKDGTTTWLGCSVWDKPAENVAESLTKGVRVIVQGRLSTREYETREGEKRSSLELQVDAIGPELRFTTARVAGRTEREDGRAGRRPANQQAADPWATPAPTGGTDPWATPAGSDEPPF